jgi:hypothetical protein
MIAQIFRNEKSKWFFSFIIGLGASILLFHKPFVTKPTLPISVEEVEKEVVKVDGRCYKYVAEDTQCEILRSK